MDSLQVTNQQQSHHHHQQQQPINSKTSSRSASPCRLDRRTPVPPPTGSTTPAANTTTTSVSAAASTNTTAEHHHPPQQHHVKTLSLGSADSTKSDGLGQQQRPASSSTARHRSPTTSTCISGAVRGSGGGGVGGGGDTVMDDNSFLNATSSSAMGADDSLLFLASASGLDCTDQELYPSSYISNGSSEHKATTGGAAGDEEADGSNARAAAVLEQLNNKIVRVKDLIRTEQKLRDDNVYEYLKLASNADKQQVQRIKAVFEKKNQKSAQVILQLQKKLNNYQKRCQELEHGVYTQSSHRPPREVLRDMGQGLKNVGGNIRDGITGFSGSVMSKPREFAHLIKNKFGSADNISQMSRPTGTTGSEGSGTNVSGSDADAKGAAQQTVGVPGAQQQQSQQHAHAHHHGHHHHGRVGHGSATLPASLHAATSHHSVGGQGGPHKFPSDEGSECSSVTSESLERYHSSRGAEALSDKDVYNMFNKQLQAHQLEIERLCEKVEASKGHQQEMQFLNNSLQDERFKTERLEEQINDLTELHQNEVENLKQTMADMEEKVQYQSEERLRDIHEMLEHCQTKIQKMEHQALQQQQYVMLEGLDNSNARALVVKLINVLLTVLQVVLLLVATCAGIIMPFLRTRVRILTTLTIVFAAVFILRQWPEVADIGSHVMKRLKDTLDPVK